MSFQSIIEHPEVGWMRMRFVGENAEIDLFASYTPHDTFHELITALHAVYECGNSHDVSINEEPDESVLTLARIDTKLTLILNRKDGGPTTQIETDFESGCSKIARNIYQVYKDMGHEAFQKEWNHRPPNERIEELWTRFVE